MAIVWAALAGSAYAVFRRQSRGAAIVAAAVLSHWVLDFVTHRPDLPLWPPDGPLVGLGLWNSVGGTVAAEALLFSVGLWLYATHTEATDRAGPLRSRRVRCDPAAHLRGESPGPPPPNTDVLAIIAQGQWLFVLWAIWIDRHRVAIRQWR